MFGNSAWKFTQLSQFWLQLYNKHKNMSAYSQEDSQCTIHCDFPFITVSIPEMKTPPQHNTRDHKAQGADFMITWVGARVERVCTNPPSKQKHTHTGGRSLVWWCPGNPSVLTPGELLWLQAAGGGRLVVECLYAEVCPNNLIPKGRFESWRIGRGWC